MDLASFYNSDLMDLPVTVKEAGKVTVRPSDVLESFSKPPDLSGRFFGLGTVADFVRDRVRPRLDSELSPMARKMKLEDFLSRFERPIQRQFIGDPEEGARRLVEFHRAFNENIRRAGRAAADYRAAGIGMGSMLAAGSAATGLGIGAVQGARKMKDVKDVKVKEASVKSAILDEAAGNVMNELRRTWVGSGVPPNMLTAFGPATLPIYAASVTLPLVAAHRGADVLTDKLRASALERKKRKAKAEFESLLRGDAAPEMELKTASFIRGVDSLADEFVKQAADGNKGDTARTLTNSAAGLYLLLLAMGSGAAYGVGHNLGMRNDTGKARLDAMRTAYRNQKFREPPKFQLSGSSAPASPYKVPIQLPSASPKDDVPERDEAMDLTKLSSLSKESRFGIGSGGQSVMKRAREGFSKAIKPAEGGWKLSGGLEDARKSFAGKMQGAKAIWDNLDQAPEVINNLRWGSDQIGKVRGAAEGVQNAFSGVGQAGSSSVNMLLQALERTGGQMQNVGSSIYGRNVFSPR